MSLLNLIEIIPISHHNPCATIVYTEKAFDHYLSCARDDLRSPSLQISHLLSCFFIEFLIKIIGCTLHPALRTPHVFCYNKQC
jgi:hypothetical protein